MRSGEVITGELAGDGTRLDKALAAASGLSRERVKALLAGGQVACEPAVSGGNSARVIIAVRFAIALPPPADLAAQPQDIALDIVHEDSDLIVVNKPAGLVVHPAAGNADGTLVNGLLHHCAGGLSGIGGIARPGIVHRIDKDTSGLLVVAKSAVAHEGLSRQFAAHSIHRRYLAVCVGHPVPAAGTIATRIGRSDHDRKKMAVLPDNATRGKRAITHYHVIERLNECALIECRLETGRTHQIRVHCASIGHALLGDPVYGRTPSRLKPVLAALQFERQALHAAELGFVHPATGETLLFRAGLPNDMQELIDKTAR